MLDPIKSTIVTPGLNLDGKFDKTGIPASIVTKYLAEHGVVVEKTGLYSFFIMFTIGITKGRWNTLLTALQQFKDDYDRNQPLWKILPEFVAKQPRYERVGLREELAVAQASSGVNQERRLTVRPPRLQQLHKVRGCIGESPEAIPIDAEFAQRERRALRGQLGSLAVHILRRDSHCSNLHSHSSARARPDRLQPSRRFLQITGHAPARERAALVSAPNKAVCHGFTRHAAAITPHRYSTRKSRIAVEDRTKPNPS